MPEGMHAHEMTTGEIHTLVSAMVDGEIQPEDIHAVVLIIAVNCPICHETHDVRVSTTFSERVNAVQMMQFAAIQTITGIPMLEGCEDEN